VSCRGGARSGRRRIVDVLGAGVSRSARVWPPYLAGLSAARRTCRGTRWRCRTVFPTRSGGRRADLWVWIDVDHPRLDELRTTKPRLASRSLGPSTSIQSSLRFGGTLRAGSFGMPRCLATDQPAGPRRYLATGRPSGTGDSTGPEDLTGFNGRSPPGPRHLRGPGLRRPEGLTSTTRPSSHTRPSGPIRSGDLIGSGGPTRPDSARTGEPAGPSGRFGVDRESTGARARRVSAFRDMRRSPKSSRLPAASRLVRTDRIHGIGRIGRPGGRTEIGGSFDHRRRIDALRPLKTRPPRTRTLDTRPCWPCWPCWSSGGHGRRGIYADRVPGPPGNGRFVLAVIMRQRLDRPLGAQSLRECLGPGGVGGC
jgi:hypothetical protein